MVSKNILKDVDINASFDFVNFSIILRKMKERDYQRSMRSMVEAKNQLSSGCLQLNEYRDLVDFYSLVNHEFTHFIDSTSTVWGMRHLTMLNDSFLSLKAGESEFYKIKIFIDYLRKIRLPKYYNLIDKKINATVPWRYSITSGLLFDSAGHITNETVFFVRFLNESDNLVVRSPISTVSILEASAMAEEVNVTRGYLRLLDPNSLDVEKKEIENKILSFIYDRNLTEYSVCAHLVSNFLKISDVFLSYDFCSELTKVVLNSTSYVYMKIKEHDLFLNHFKVESGDLGRVELGLDQGNMGVLFYVLCMFLPEACRSVESVENKSLDQFDKADVNESIEKLLGFFGLSFFDLYEHAETEVKNHAQCLSKSPEVGIQHLAKSGLANFKLIRKGKNNLDYTSLHLPPVFLADGEVKYNIYNNSSNILIFFDAEKVYYDYSEKERLMNNFAEACV